MTRQLFKILFIFLFTAMLTADSALKAETTLSFSDTTITLLKNELWWGGAVAFGNAMPFGEKDFAFDLNADRSQNQAVPLLISSEGRWLWSETAFRYSFQDGQLLISAAAEKIIFGKAGNSLKNAYQFVSKNFFPSSGKWPDSLLVTAPQYNLWIELMYHPTQKAVLNYAHKVLENGLPAGVLMIDDNWGNYYGAFDFDKDKFPDAKSMMTQLHSLGFKTMVWVCPFISPDSEAFRELAAKKLLLLDNEGDKNIFWSKATKPLLIKWWNGYSACLDLTNPETEKWLKNKLNNLQNTYKVDGFKFDAGDAYFYNNPNLISYKSATPNEHSQSWGAIGLAYSLNEYRAMWKMGGQPLVQRLADKDHSWEALQLLIPNSLAQQLAGYTFTCPDMIGGGQFTSFLPGNKIDQKLIVRSAQLHALMPMMQFSVAPWRILDFLHLQAVKKAVALRQNYLPQIMNVLQQSALTGEPALQPLEYNFPHQGLGKIKDQFMLGENLMVAPIVTALDEREVIFPKGKWKYKNKIYSGPAAKIFEVALDELLIFEKIK